MRLTTSTTGTGPRHVALVHGLGGNGATWAPLIERMIATGRYTVTTVDLRGHGSSDRAPSYALGWDIRRLPRVHHDMQLENPDGTFHIIEDVL